MRHHAEGLRVLGAEEGWLEAFARDPWSVPLEPRDRALLRWAERLTRAPASVTRADVDALRAAGYDDEAILHAVEVVAYFNFVNRLADGLGVELERAGAEG